jgi:hypothetical protein
MTLIEAIKSGRNFRRKGDHEWLVPPAIGFFHPHEIIADDYELDEKKVEITRSHLDAALERARDSGLYYPPTTFLAKELGLE